MFKEATKPTGNPSKKGEDATGDDSAEIGKPKRRWGFFSRGASKSAHKKTSVRGRASRKKFSAKGRRVSKQVQKAVKASVVIDQENSDEAFVLAYVAAMKRHNPSWKPEKSTLGDGETTFGECWKAEPRDYTRLATIIRRVLSLTR